MTRWETLRFQISPWLAHEGLKDIFFFRRAQLLASPGVCCSRIRNSRLRQASPAAGCVPRSVEKERRPPLRHQGIISGGNLRVFENLARTLVAVDAS